MHTCTMHIIVSWKTQKRNLSSRSHEGLWPWHIRTNSLKLHDYTSIIIVITVNIVIIPTMYSLLTWHDLKPACEGMSTLDLWQPPSMPHLWRSTKNVSPWNFFLAQRFWKWLWIPWNVQPKFPQMGELCRWELCRWELCSFAVVQMGEFCSCADGSCAGRSQDEVRGTLASPPQPPQLPSTFHLTASPIRKNCTNPGISRFFENFELVVISASPAEITLKYLSADQLD